MCCHLPLKLLKNVEKKGFSDGFGKGLDSEKLIQLIELVQSGDLTEERASQKAGMTLEKFREKMQKEIH